MQQEKDWSKDRRLNLFFSQKIPRENRAWLVVTLLSAIPVVVVLIIFFTTNKSAAVSIKEHFSILLEYEELKLNSAVSYALMLRPLDLSLSNLPTDRAKT